MPGIDKDQLEFLKRQIEEEYRLDMAAIERLQRRFSGHSAGGNLASKLAATSAPLTLETQSSPLASLEPLPASAQQDDITGSLRAMFSSIGK